MALIKLPPEIQSIFVYFVMAFPAVIVLLFFLVLYHKNYALYAPSDFANQDHYLAVNEIKQNVDIKLDKVFAQINKNGERLSKEEISSAKIEIEKTFDTYASLSIMQRRIFEHVIHKPSNADEIRDRFELSSSTVRVYLSHLEQKGLIKFDGKNWSRSVQQGLN